MAIIAHAYEQASATGVGECRYRLGQFGGISDLVFEVLLLMLTLCNELVEKSLFAHGKKRGVWLHTPMIISKGKSCNP